MKPNDFLELDRLLSDQERDSRDTIDLNRSSLGALHLAANGRAGQAGGAAAAPPAPGAGEEDALDLGPVVFRTPAVRRGPLALLGGLLLLVLLTGRRRQVASA